MGDEPPSADVPLYGAPQHLDPVVSSVAVFGLAAASLLLLFVIAVAWLRHLARARDARDAAEGAVDGRRSDGALATPGPRVVCGRVVAPEELSTDAPVQVTIRQRLRVPPRGGPLWVECERTAHATPFEIELRSGRRLRVEPGTRFHLVDKLDRLERLGPDERVRTAQLAPGERVYVAGDLAPAAPGRVGAVAFRAADASMPVTVLRPPRYGSMLLSTAPLDEPSGARARWHGRALLVVATLLLGAHGLLLGGYYARRVAGRVEWATVDRTIVSNASYGRRAVVRYYVHASRDADRVRADERDWFDAEVTPSVAQQLRRGDRVPFYVVGPAGGRAQYGARPTAGLTDVGLTWMVWYFVVIGYVLAARRSRPWYAGGRVIDRHDMLTV